MKHRHHPQAQLMRQLGQRRGPPADYVGVAKPVTLAWHLEVVRLRDERELTFPAIARLLNKPNRDYVRTLYYRTKRRMAGVAGHGRKAT